ncbi:signal transduction histidine kinase/FixJ family two-component response regulator [Azospirillum lipoferum]|uniref:ATP-binding response regulator n=1 Tax=Azospirillum TaxID=191 RepID=UPI001FEA3079|nr:MULTISPECIES: hybrid sensor histidine kinase/response regulator [Azospirillum]MCP1614482.1 signal transduction histidine kinase/FixJ family two-component response regulator [Azospirillum lipoferum]MDW5532686.1 hybrid sensor histidine kinase/response regulator [Azospirillum sp. NL1]
MSFSAALRRVAASPRMLVAFLCALLALLGTASWATVTALDYRDTLQRAESDAREAAILFDSHARGVLEASVALLQQVAGRMDGRGLNSWAERTLPEAMAVERSGRVTLLSADGSTLYGPSVAFAEPETSDGLSLLVRPLPPEEERHILPAFGHMAGQPAILLARRIHTAAGVFDGAVLVAVPVAALEPVLKAFGDASARSVGLYRSDGIRLAGLGALSLGPLPRLEAGTIRVNGKWMVTGKPSILGVKRMAGLPILSAVTIPRTTVLDPWYVRMERGLVVVVAGVAALAGLSMLGAASLRREAAAREALTEANAQLEQANVQLEQRVEERTSALSALNVKLSRALEEKERANQAKGRFLSAANHDLRQPFQALRLFHHILMERLADTRDRGIAEKMGEALDAGEKLLHALLEVATLDAGVVRPQLTDVPVSAVFEGLLAEFRGMAAEKGLVLRAMPTRMVIRTDRTLLTRMLGDLVRNAIRFTEKGRVTIGCRHQGNRQGIHRGRWLRIEVWDTGTGIPPDQLDNIFEDFVQLGNPERDRRQGLGLGLAKVRRKAALLGHAVEVRSRQGRGSVFAISVPVVGTERLPIPAPVQDADPVVAGDRLILVVEDDPIQRDAVRLLLESWDYRVMAADEGENALALFGGAKPQDGSGSDMPVPDLIVSDFRLPGRLTGVQTVAKVGEWLGRPVPGLILTGDTAPERIREAVATGCRLLHKPVSPEELRDAIASILSERPGCRPADGGEQAMENESAA